MVWVKSMQKAIDYMETNLLEKITVDDIAKQAHVSPFHFQRLFRILTNVSVGEYLRRRRLTLAAQELTSSDDKVIDLAYKYGYDTPEAFSKAFRKHHGLTPSEARKGLGKLQSYNRLMIQVNLKGAVPMKYRIVEKDVIRVVGVKREIPCNAEGGSPTPGIVEFWAELNRNGTVNRLIQRMNGDIKGPLGITCNFNEAKNTIEYWIGVEHQGDVSSEFSSKELPPAKWIVFEVNGPVPTAMPKAWKQIYSEWFPSNGYEPAEQPPFEVYLDSNPMNENATNEIWIAVK